LLTNVFPLHIVCTLFLGTLVADRGGDVGVDCTVQGQSFFKAIFKENFECLRTSCVSWWESGEGGPFSDEYREGLEGLLSDLAGADDVECKIYSASADSSAVGAGETSTVGTNASEDTGAAEEGSSVGTNAGEDTGAAEEGSSVGTNAGEDTGAAEEGSSVGTNAGEDTVVAKASSVGSRESKANGMLALAATAAAAALVFF
jgi:hypothetical protein